MTLIAEFIELFTGKTTSRISDASEALDASVNGNGQLKINGGLTDERPCENQGEDPKAGKGNKG